MKAFVHENLFKLDGDIPVVRAIPYGIQHILAMFVANLAPILIVGAAAGLADDQLGMLVQSAMLIAGIGTLIQLFPLWRVGSGLPIVMGISFTFVTVLVGIAATYGYNVAIGAIIVGGIIEGVLGLFAKYWRRIISPIVAAVVVTSIGFSLLGVGASSFGGGSGAADFGSPQNLLLGTISLVSCLVFQVLAKGKTKQLSVLFGLVIGYACAVVAGAVDFSGFQSMELFALPQLMPFTPEFNLGAIVSVTLIFLVSATETIGDTSALTMVGLNREVKEKELSGSIACDGFVSSLSACFGCLPITSFSQNVGLVAMTKVVNRKAIATGAVIMILAAFLPVISVIFASLPEAVLGGCTIMMRQHHRQRLPDDRAGGLLAAQHPHRGAVAGRGHRLHAGVGPVRELPRADPKRVRAELRGRGVPGGRGGEPRAAEGRRHRGRDGDVRTFDRRGGAERRRGRRPGDGVTPRGCLGACGDAPRGCS